MKRSTASRMLSAALTFCMVMGMLTTAPISARAETGAYNQTDIETVNSIIAENGLNAAEDDPDSWNFAEWNDETPKRITTLNLDNSSLTGDLEVSGLSALTALYLNNNAIQSISGFDRTPQLKKLNLEHNRISTLDVSENPELEVLNLASNQLAAIDVSSNTKLTELYVDDNKLTEIDVRSNTELQTFYCQSNQLTALDVTQNPQLADLRCNRNKIEALDISNNTALTYLNCRNNKLAELDVRANTDLETLECGNNQLTALDVSQNTGLTRLTCQNNNIHELDISTNTKLRHFLCHDNQLTSLDVSQNLELVVLFCGENALETLNLENLQRLSNLHCEKNPDLTELIVPADIQLNFLDIRMTGITQLDLSTQTSEHFVHYGAIPESSNFDATGKYVLQIILPDDNDEIDTQNEGFHNHSLTLQYHPKSNTTFTGWTIDPPMPNVDPTDNPIDLILIQGITTVTANVDSSSTGSAPSITTTSLPKGTINKSYSQTVAATGTGPIHFEITGGSLPDGLTLSDSGRISGTPTKTGQFDFTVKATNQSGSATKDFGIEIGTSGGGSSSGSSGAADPSTPKPEAVTDKGTSTAMVEPSTTTSGNSTNVTVSENAISAAIEIAAEAAKESGTRGSVEIKVNTEKETDVKVTIPTVSLEAVAGSDVDTLKITSTIGEIELDSSALAAIAGGANGTTVSIEIDKANPLTKLTQEQRETVGELPVYDISITSNGTIINSLGGGTATVTLPYTLKEGEDPQNIVIYYVYTKDSSTYDTDRTHLVRMNTTYDPETQTVTFLTSHFSLYAIGHWENPFTDVTQNAWYYEDVAFAAVNGIMSGTGETAFTPDGTMTRAMVVTVLYRLTGEPAVADMAGIFSDLEESSYYFSAVLWASQNGLVQGVGQDQFAPDARITRQDFAVILANYIAQAATNLSTTEEWIAFADEDHISDYAKNAVQTLYKLSIMQGTGAGSISPQGDMTRAEAAAMLHRFAVIEL